MQVSCRRKHVQKIDFYIFFSSIADQSEDSSISRDGSHWIIHKRKQTARNEVKPLKLKCRSLSFHKSLACNLSDLPSLHPIQIFVDSMHIT